METLLERLLQLQSLTGNDPKAAGMAKAQALRPPSEQSIRSNFNAAAGQNAAMAAMYGGDPAVPQMMGGRSKFMQGLSDDFTGGLKKSLALQSLGGK